MELSKIDETEIFYFKRNKILDCLNLYELLKTSLGPISLDKMIIDNIGNITITNDGASILKKIEINDPISKILIDLSLQQDDEIGDGTTSIVIITAELLKRAVKLIEKGIHPSLIISAYRLAMCHSCFLLKNKLSISSDNLDLKTLFNAAKTSLSSKISGVNSKKFAALAVQAVKSVQTSVISKKKIHCQLKAIEFVKIEGSGMNKSKLVDGYVMRSQKTSTNYPIQISPVRILCINQDLRKLRNKVGIQIETKEIKDVHDIIKKELEFLLNLTNQILQSGANVILTTKGIDDLASKIISKNGCIGIRRVTIESMRKLSIATGAKISILQINKTDKKNEKIVLGKAEEIFEEKISHSDVLIFRGCRFNPGNSIILRGPTGYLVDEIERSLIDALNMIKKVIESKKIVPGGGATETAICIFLENLAYSISTREQLPILEFADALMQIPKILLVNSGLNKTSLIEKLKIIHKIGIKYNKSAYLQFGLDVFLASTRNNINSGIIEPTISKIRCIQIATEAAISILRIDDFIVSPKESSNIKNN